MTIGRWLVWAFVLLFSAAAGRSEAAGPSCDAGKCVNLAFDGDSTSAGAGASPGHGLDTRVAAMLGADVRWHNVAASGTPVSECLRLYSQLVTPLVESFRT